MRLPLRLNTPRALQLLRRPWLLALVLVATAALAFQATRILSRPPAPTALASLTPQGALLTIESPDFAALLGSWNRSPEQKAWLASANWSVFSNSRLFGRLSDAETEFAEASQVPAARLLPQVAGRESLFAWYDIHNLEFLYITRMPAGQAAATDLLKSRGKWQQRQAGGTTFYVRTAASTTGSARRTVAFASAQGLLLVATREDLVADALKLLAQAPAGRSAGSAPSPGALTQEPWFQQASAALPAEARQPPMLHMVLNLERIVPMPQFRSYWVQQNISEFKRYRSSVADLYRDPSGSFREERALLLEDQEPAAPDPDLAPLAARAPADSVFRASSTATPDDAIAALEEKLLGQAAPAETAATDAPDPSLAATQAGSEGSLADLETRIDTLPPVSEAASNQALSSVLRGAGFDALMTCSSAPLPAAPGVLWVPVRSAVVLHAARPWNPQTVASALEQSLRGSLTTSTFGIEFRPVARGGHTIHALDGPSPLVFAIAGLDLILANSEAELEAMLTVPGPAPQALPATLITAFNHTAQRPGYARITSLIDGSVAPDSKSNADANSDPKPDAPAFFSGNLRSLSDTFARLQSERLVERHADSPSGPILRQTVTYQWQP